MFICQECGAAGARRDTWLECLQCLHHNITVWGSSSHPSSHLHTSGFWRLHSVWTEQTDLESRNWQFKYRIYLLAFIFASLLSSRVHKLKIVIKFFISDAQVAIDCEWIIFYHYERKYFRVVYDRQNVKHKFYKIQKIISRWWHGVWSPGKEGVTRISPWRGKAEEVEKGRNVSKVGADVIVCWLSLPSWACHYGT